MRQLLLNALWIEQSFLHNYLWSHCCRPSRTASDHQLEGCSRSNLPPLKSASADYGMALNHSNLLLCVCKGTTCIYTLLPLLFAVDIGRIDYGSWWSCRYSDGKGTLWDLMPFGCCRSLQRSCENRWGKFWSWRRETCAYPPVNGRRHSRDRNWIELLHGSNRTSWSWKSKDRLATSAH